MLVRESELDLNYAEKIAVGEKINERPNQTTRHGPYKTVYK